MSESDFIGLCIELTRAGYREEPVGMQRSEAKFMPAAEDLAAGIKRCPRGIHVHLYQGFSRLFNERQDYDEADILNWLEQMRVELEKNIDRLSRMRSAASSEADTKTITKNLTSAGLQDIQFELFMTPGNEQPVAWSLSAVRPVL